MATLAPCRPCTRKLPLPALVLALAGLPAVHAAEVTTSGRMTFGSVVRLEERDPQLLTGVNAAAIGLQGFGSGGNADDANMNYARGDAASTAIKAYLDLAAREGAWSALVRVKAWHDAALEERKRPWGNVANGYAPDAPLSDAGAPRLSRFSGVALGEAWLQYSTEGGPDRPRYTARLGRQSLNWGERPGMAGTPGGLEALNPKDSPALRRAGAVPQEMRVAAPMLFGRADLGPAFGVEAWYQRHHTPTAIDMCGSLWSLSDYLTPGCDFVMSGQPPVSDRARIALGATMGRLPTPKVDKGEYGLGFTWKPGPLEFGLYHARYNARTALPSLRRSTRVGAPPLLAGNPDGRNMAYFTEYVEGLAISALSFAHKRGRTSFYGEASYRPRLPLMLAPGDVLPPFLSATAPSLLRASANAVPPGGVFHGYDLYAMSQLQLGAGHEWHVGKAVLTASAEIVGKHLSNLPDPSVRRYGRADIFGVGRINGACTPTTGDPERQCSLRGYATPNSYGYRVRFDARMPVLVEGLAGGASVTFAHDLKGWAGDFLINEGRKTANLALRFEYRKRYLLELSWLPNWGGDYNQVADRDVAALAAGVRF